MKESEILEGLILSFGKKEYSLAQLLALSAPFSVSDSSLRTWLSRRVKQGFLGQRKAARTSFYGLSAKGQRIGSNVSRSFKTAHWTSWKGQWWGFVFSTSDNHKRHSLRNKLQAYRFTPWYKGFWIRPQSEDEQIPQVLQNPEYKKLGRLMSFMPQQAFTDREVQRLWKIPALQKEYQQATIVIQHSMKCITQLNPPQALVQRISMGNEMVPLIFKDPLLPEVFLPQDWAAPQFKESFFTWDKEITQRSKPFWEEILKNP
ncbi:MAG: hypothetical protein PF447_03845 [Spirochaetaceae bacterium]|jgi:DNA-binding transcriptional regulator PaaX|nr:hypothetical protein [Spirochaetaceae bacterium]